MFLFGVFTQVDAFAGNGCMQISGRKIAVLVGVVSGQLHYCFAGVDFKIYDGEMAYFDSGAQLLQHDCMEGALVMCVCHSTDACEDFRGKGRTRIVAEVDRLRASMRQESHRKRKQTQQDGHNNY